MEWSEDGERCVQMSSTPGLYKNVQDSAEILHSACERDTVSYGGEVMPVRFEPTDSFDDC